MRKHVNALTFLVLFCSRTGHKPKLVLLLVLFCFFVLFNHISYKLMLVWVLLWNGLHSQLTFSLLQFCCFVDIAITQI